MSNNTDLTKAAIDNWQLPHTQLGRYNMIMKLAMDAGVFKEFSEVPKIHYDLMDYNKFMINVLALAKIRELKAIGKQQPTQQPKKKRWPW